MSSLESKVYSRTIAMVLTAVAVIALAAVAAASAAAVSANEKPRNTCEMVAARTAIEMLNPLTVEYNTEQTDYWSTGCGALKPSCIIAPSNDQEVAAAVAALRDFKNESFAVKSGGHNPNNGWASVEGGPIISTRNLDEVSFDLATETVRVGPGNRWDEVAKALDGTGYTVIGGRIGNVGVGGYLLGGERKYMQPVSFIDDGGGDSLAIDLC